LQVADAGPDETVWIFILRRGDDPEFAIVGAEGSSLPWRGDLGGAHFDDRLSRDDLHIAESGDVVGGPEPASLLDRRLHTSASLGDAERMMLLDMLTYLPDDILTKVDRASMSVSLECRAPFLDHRVVEFAWRMPEDLKYRDGQSKWALRQILYKHVPRALLDRPKMGFEVPIAAWLRGPLRSWAEDLLAADRLRRDDVFDVMLVRKMWEEHQSATCNWGPQLWNVLMFQAWLDEAAAAPLAPHVPTVRHSERASRAGIMALGGLLQTLPTL